MSLRLFSIAIILVTGSILGCSSEDPVTNLTEPLPPGDENRPLDPGLSYDFACLRSGPIENPILAASRPLDGIPALIDPDFIPVKDVDYLSRDDWVFGVEIDGVFLAFPARILNYHEVVTFNVGEYRYTASW